jgi:hypothetical protein
MNLVDLSDSYDLHVHASPELFVRIGDDMDIARHAAQSGLAGIMIKNHFESTVGRAALVDRIGSGVRVFGGLVLNWSSGGLNPLAVETALKLGARQIWMPTVDATAHAVAYGMTGGFNHQKSGLKLPRPGISVLEYGGKLKSEAKIIVELVKEADAILGTGHLSRDEIFALADFAFPAGLKKFLITHPEFNPPALSIEDQKLLTTKGAFLELCGGNLYPIPGVGRIDDYRRIVAEAGADAIILTSDAGQPRKSWPAEVLRIFGQCLLEKGVSQEEINLMTKENPARLLGL